MTRGNRQTASLLLWIGLHTSIYKCSEIGTNSFGILKLAGFCTYSGLSKKIMQTKSNCVFICSVKWIFPIKKTISEPKEDKRGFLWICMEIFWKYFESLTEYFRAKSFWESPVLESADRYVAHLRPMKIVLHYFLLL